MAVVLSLIAAAAVVGVILSVSGGRTADPVANQAGECRGPEPGCRPGHQPARFRRAGLHLTDQYGSRISLRQFRGRAVVIAFVDARCTTVCPLTTVSLTEAPGRHPGR